MIPGNEGRGYVLRRITRRAIRHGYKLGARRPFFHTLVAALVAEMGDAYPELRREQARITEVLQPGGGALLPDHRQRHGDPRVGAGRAVRTPARRRCSTARLAFKLHDTYGFPLDLTADVCRERGVTVDTRGFDAAMSRQREQARAAGKFKMAQGLEYSGAATTFHGYEQLSARGARSSPRSIVDGSAVEVARAGDDVVVVLDHTPFYAE